MGVVAAAGLAGTQLSSLACTVLGSTPGWDANSFSTAFRMASFAFFGVLRGLLFSVCL